jgi:WD40 repeat protein
MSPVRKFLIPFIVTLLFLVSCSSASPSPAPTEQGVAPSQQPVQVTPTSAPPSTQPAEITPTEMKRPTSTPALPVIGNYVIVFGSDRGGDFMNIFTLNTSNGLLTQLTMGDSNTFPGPYSPDGKLLLFTGFGLTNSYVGVMNADGTDPLDLSARPNVDEGFPTWSPNGQQIVFTSRKDGNNEIYLMDADGTNLKRLTDNPADDFAPAFSPDGHQIAFVSDRDNPAT